jgi:hypothetical protein
MRSASRKKTYDKITRSNDNANIARDSGLLVVSAA